MTRVSLKELNSNGQLIMMFKQTSFVSAKRETVIKYFNGDPNTIYLHFYHGLYYVTYHVISTQQISYYFFEDAKSFLLSLI